MTLDRPTWIDIDLEAIRHNVRTTRRLVGPNVKIFVVCKGDGYGIGAGVLAKTAIEAGADAAACSSPSDASAIRSAGVTAPILLYASTSTVDAAATVSLGVIPTIHDFSSLDAFSELSELNEVYIKIDCGFGRLGFTAPEWSEAFQRLASSSRFKVAGLYCHLGSTEDRAKLELQLEKFHSAVAQAKAAGLHDLVLMIASSRVTIGQIDFNMNAVNPGRMICGILEEPWNRLADIRPVLTSLKSKLIQVKMLAAGSTLAYGEAVIGRDMLIAIAPVGFADGYPRLPAGGVALIRGQRVPILGSRATEHTTFDVTDVDGVAVNDEVVLLGRQGEHVITGNDIADHTGVPLIELLPRIGRLARRVYHG